MSYLLATNLEYQPLGFSATMTNRSGIINRRRYRSKNHAGNKKGDNGWRKDGQTFFYTLTSGLIVFK